jgi:alginate O-acetyltransferase complex protein AlgJ
MNFKRRIEKLLIFCFIVAVFLPLLLSNKIGGQVSNDENRTMAKFPSLFNQDSSVILSGFRSGLENWINDNAFGRKQATSLNTLIDMEFFHQHTTKDVMYGKNNWLYMMNDNNIKRIQHSDVPSEAELNQFSQKIIGIKNYFNKNNSNFFITVFPNKIDIYPENLLNQFQQVNPESLLDVFKNLSNSKNFDLSEIYENMIREKNSDPNRLLYYKAADTNHWNHYGAFIGYTDVMANVKKYLPNIKVLTKDDFNISPVQKQTMIAKQVYTTETDYDFQLKRPRTAVNDQSYFDKIGFQSNDPWKSYRYYKNSNSKLPKALIIGDSYTWEFMLPDMAESFSELVFLHQADENNLGQIPANFHPDIVIMDGLTETVWAGINGFNVNQARPTQQNISARDSSLISSLKEIGLPTEQHGGMFLDSANDSKVSEQGKITLSKDADSVDLVGWAADFKAVGTLKGIYVQCGDKLISGKYGIERTSVSDYYKTPNLKNTGFQFHLTKDDLMNNTLNQISFILVGYNGTYKFKPAVYQISYN